MCVPGDVIKEWYKRDCVCSMRCNKIITNTTGPIIKGSTKKEEALPSRVKESPWEWRITEAKEQYFTEESPISNVKYYRVVKENKAWEGSIWLSIISSQEDESWSKSSTSAEFWFSVLELTNFLQ